MGHKKREQRADEGHDGNYSDERKQSALDLFLYGICPKPDMDDTNLPLENWDAGFVYYFFLQ